MMVADPERHVDQVAAAGGDSFTFHVEATDDPGRTRDVVPPPDCRSASPPTREPPSQSSPDTPPPPTWRCAWAFTPGSRGSRSSETVPVSLDCRRSGLPHGVRIQVDGGVGADNLIALRDAGADLFRGR